MGTVHNVGGYHLYRENSTVSGVTKVTATPVDANRGEASEYYEIENFDAIQLAALAKASDKRKIELKKLFGSKSCEKNMFYTADAAQAVLRSI